MKNMQNTAAKRYAEAFYSLAQEEALVPQLAGQLNLAAGQWQGNQDLRGVILNPRLAKAQKHQLVSLWLEELGALPLFQNLLGVMLDKGRIDLLPQVAQEFQAMDDRDQGRVRAVCKHAHPLSQNQKLSLEQKLMELSGARAMALTWVLEPSLLGGFVVTIGGKTIDGSLKGRLNRASRIS